MLTLGSQVVSEEGKGGNSSFPKCTALSASLSTLPTLDHCTSMNQKKDTHKLLTQTLNKSSGSIRSPHHLCCSLESCLRISWERKDIHHTWWWNSCQRRVNTSGVSCHLPRGPGKNHYCLRLGGEEDGWEGQSTQECLPSPASSSSPQKHSLSLEAFLSTSILELQLVASQNKQSCDIAIKRERNIISLCPRLSSVFQPPLPSV